MSGGGGDNKVKQTWGEKEQAKIFAEQWNRYQKYGVDAENEFINEAQMKDKDYEQAAAFSNIDTQAAFGNNPAVQAGQQRGGSLAVGIADKALDMGESLSSNLAVSGIQTDDRHLQGKMSIVSAGMGKGVMAQDGITSVANSNLNNAINDAYSSYENRQSNIDTAFGAGGMAARGLQKPSGDFPGAVRPRHAGGEYQQGPFDENDKF